MFSTTLNKIQSHNYVKCFPHLYTQWKTWNLLYKKFTTVSFKFESYIWLETIYMSALLCFQTPSASIKLYYYITFCFIYHLWYYFKSWTRVLSITKEQRRDTERSFHLRLWISYLKLAVPDLVSNFLANFQIETVMFSVGFDTDIPVLALKWRPKCKKW